VHPRLRRRLERLARRGTTPAEARRRVRPLARKLGLPAPSYASALRIVKAAREAEKRRRGEPGVLDSLALGRMPTPRELEGTFERLRERSG
jgi:hypothetical protein